MLAGKAKSFFLQLPSAINSNFINVFREPPGGADGVFQGGGLHNAVM
jgi:hypothetical protein